MKSAGFSIKAGLVFNNVLTKSASLEAIEAGEAAEAEAVFPSNGLAMAAAAAACFNMLTVSKSAIPGALGVLEVLKKERQVRLIMD